MRLLLAGDETGADRQFRGGELERLARDLGRHAVQLEHDPARLHPSHPEFGRPLAAAHADLGRLGGHRHIRKDADPDAADAANVAGNGAPRRLDLARRDAARIDGLHAKGAEIQRGAALGDAVNAALMRFAVFGAFRLKHRPLASAIGAVAVAIAVTAAGRLPLGELLVLRHRVVREDLALEHPYLDAAGAVGGFRRRGAVIDIRAQRVQWHAALAVPFHAGNLGAAEPTAAIDADALGAEPHRRLHRPLHRAPKGDAALQLLGDALGDQLRLDLGLADLDDVEADLAVGDLGDVAAQLVDVGALFADHHARPRRMQRVPGTFRHALDHHLVDRRLGQALAEELAELQVVEQLRPVFLAREPARVPGAVDPEPQPDRIDFLAHQAASSASSSARSRTITVRCAKCFSTRAERPRPRVWKRFITKARPTVASLT